MRKLLKKSTAFALTLLLLLTVPWISANAEEKPSFTLGVTVFPGSGGQTVDVWFDADDGGAFLFLPAGADTSSMTVSLSGANMVMIDGALIADGSVTGALSVGEHTLVAAGKAYTLTVLRSSGLPAVFIDTESGSLQKIQADKNNKESGRITVIENGRAVIDGAALKSVKGRGNSTWAADKKPYNIKFDQKTDVLGMGKAKKWSLLANHFDASLLRNSVALDLAAAFGLPFTSEYRMVDLYANGEYQGAYLITESVEVGDTRVNITDLEKANEDANPGTDIEDAKLRTEKIDGVKDARMWADISSPRDVTGGYLLECEFGNRYPEEASGFITEHGQRMVLKSPEFASRKEVDYIAGIWGEMEQALYSPDGYNAKGKHYSDYFDMDALVRMYILTEYTCHRDAGMSSCYFYKDAGESVFHAGPAWDFDLSLGNPRYNGGHPFDVKDAGTWWANSMFYPRSDEVTQTIFTLLYKHDDFRGLVSAKWRELSGIIDAELELLTRMTDETAPSAVMNAFRWGLLTGKTPEDKEASYRDAADVLEKFASSRRSALDKGFGADAAMVYYDANGGAGAVFNGTVLSIGDTVVLREINHKVTPITAPEESEFAGWNTRPDGSGPTYQPGDSFLVIGKTTVLYARWRSTHIDIPDPTEKDGWYSPGDVDLDGKITAADARFALRMSAGLLASNPVWRKLADVDADDKVLASDARKILRASAQLDGLPEEKVFVPAGQARPY